MSVCFASFTVFFLSPEMEKFSFRFRFSFFSFVRCLVAFNISCIYTVLRILLQLYRIELNQVGDCVIDRRAKDSMKIKSDDAKRHWAQKITSIFQPFHAIPHQSYRNIFPAIAFFKLQLMVAKLFVSSATFFYYIFSQLFVF